MRTTLSTAVQEFKKLLCYCNDWYVFHLHVDPITLIFASMFKWETLQYLQQKSINVLILKQFLILKNLVGRSLGCLHPGNFQEIFGIPSARAHTTFSFLLFYSFTKSKQVLQGTNHLCNSP